MLKLTSHICGLLHTQHFAKLFKLPFRVGLLLNIWYAQSSYFITQACRGLRCKCGRVLSQLWKCFFHQSISVKTNNFFSAKNGGVSRKLDIKFQFFKYTSITCLTTCLQTKSFGEVCINFKLFIYEKFIASAANGQVFSNFSEPFNGRACLPKCFGNKFFLLSVDFQNISRFSKIRLPICNRLVQNLSARFTNRFFIKYVCKMSFWWMELTLV